jgi:hypothetical protein
MPEKSRHQEQNSHPALLTQGGAFYFKTILQSRQSLDKTNSAFGGLCLTKGFQL